MKKPYTSFVTGLLVGVALFSGTTAYAAGIMAERSTHRIYVDGREVQMEAYRIKGNNYVKLRDMGEAVGFEVYWDSANGCVQVESGKPYTGEAPVKSIPTPDRMVGISIRSRTARTWRKTSIGSPHVTFPNMM